MKNLLVGIALAILTSGGAAADTITLKRSVRMPADRDSLALGDIAKLAGSQAEAFAEVIVYRAADPTVLDEIAIDDIRAALDKHEVNWGRVHLSGQAVVVRPRAHVSVRGPEAMAPARINTAQSEVRESIEPSFERADRLMAGDTIGAAIAERIVHELGYEPHSVQVQFAAEDRAFLGRNLTVERLEIQPVSRLTGDRVELLARIWRDGRVVEQQGVTARTLVHIAVAVVDTDTSRGQAVTASAVRAEYRWMSPTEARLFASPEQVVGRRAVGSLRAGDAVRVRDTQAESVISRGDIVVVRCLSGGVVITFDAEAREHAAVGDVFELRRPGERDVFYAIATGAREAVIDLSERFSAID